MENIKIEPIGENEPSLCDCCGNTTNTVWGEAFVNDSTIAVYFVQWTSNSPDHLSNFDFILGTWGDETVKDKVLVSFTFNAYAGGGSFMAIDCDTRPAANSKICNRLTTRDEVINDPELMEKTTAIIDAIWNDDPRIQEIKDLTRNA